MTYQKTYNVNQDKKLIIELPEQFSSSKRVHVTIEDVDEDRAAKIELLKKAKNDKLFLADIHEIISDFESADADI